MPEYRFQRFSIPLHLCSPLNKVQESLHNQKYEPAKNWETHHKEITQEEIEEDFHFRILTEPNSNQETSESKDEAPHTADLLNAITGVECLEFELDPD